MKLYQLYIPLFIALFCIACEDDINVDLEDAEPLVVVDAWINDLPSTQRIVLTRSQTYFDNTLPLGITGATVTVEDQDGRVYDFAESTTAGEYTWEPTSGETFGEVGNTYTLNIAVGGATYRATSVRNAVPPIDSITFTRQQDDLFLPDGSYTAEFWVRDLQGIGDTYWIRSYKNGKLLNKPADLTVAFDAAFNSGSDFDGIPFISPIRESINPFDEDDDDEILPPFEQGDSVFVELHAITNDAFDFINEMIIQTDRNGGFAELFANPIANLPTNIERVGDIGDAAVGFFNVASVSTAGARCSDCPE